MLTLDDLGYNPLQHVTVVRYLGLYIDQHHTWQQHIYHMVSKARAQLYCIQHLHLSAYLFGLMYQVFIIPCLIIAM